MKHILTVSLLTAMFTVAVAAADQNSPSELQTAKTKLAEMRRSLSEKHPAVQKQIEHVRILEQQQKTK